MPRRARAIPATAGLLAAAAAACAPAPTLTPPRIVAPACEAVPAPGVAAVADPTGVDAQLAALDLGALPATLPVAGLDPFTLDVVAWMLDTPRAELPEVEREVAAQSALGVALLGAYANAEDGAPIDAAFLQRGLARFDACQKGWPRTLDAFRATIFAMPEPADQEIDSFPKQAPRRIWRDAFSGAFVAQTILDGAVRETEVILTDRRNDRAIEFFSYDASGALVASSTFASPPQGERTGAVPFSCMECHHSERGFFEVTPPTP